MNGFGDFLGLGAGGLQDDAFGGCLKQEKGSWETRIKMFTCSFMAFGSMSEMS